MPHDTRTPLGPSDLILSFFSLRGVDYEDRVRAAAEGGFAAIGLFISEYERLRAAGWTDADLLAVLDHHGMRLTEVEAVRLNQPSGVDIACHLADVFGADHLQVIGPHESSLDEAARVFGAICDECAPHGMRCGIEFLPRISDIPDAASAMSIVERAGRANGGLCVDTWHHFRGANDWDLIEAIPPELVVCIQFDDGTMEPENDDYLVDTVSNRRTPGEGEFDLARFIRTLDRIGASVAYSVEVIDSDLQALPPVEVGRRLGAATRATLSAARRV